MNNDKSKNDNEGIRKEYETFHALKNIFPVFFNGIDEPSYFKNVKNKNKEEIKSNYSGSIIYLHYPNYTNHTKNTFSGVLGKQWDSLDLSSVELPVGHSALILLDDKGRSKYYEYGRYNSAESKNTHIVGRYINNYGNFRRTIIPDKNNNESLSQYVKRIAGFLPGKDAGDLEATFMSNINTVDAEKYILSIANDKKRKPYSETNTCATLASDVVNKFMNPKNKNLFTGILEYFKNNENYNAISDIMTFIPFTSHNYNAKIRNLGDSTLYFNNDENR